MIDLVAEYFKGLGAACFMQKVMALVVPHAPLEMVSVGDAAVQVLFYGGAAIIVAIAVAKGCHKCGLMMFGRA